MTKPTVLLFATALIAATPAVPAAAGGLDAYLWKARPVIVFAPSRDAPQAADQIKRLANQRAALAERAMPVFLVTDKGVTALSGGRAPAVLKAADLRQAYGVEAGRFAVVLVGKDGGEKLRSTEPVDTERLIGLVDTMPMRARETR